MKRIFCVMLMLVMLASIAAIGVSAQDPYEKILLLGDSITYGSGLDGEGKSPLFYGNLLCDYFNIKSENCKNAAVPGATSADLVKSLQGMSEDVKDADVIIISIGCNDLVGFLSDGANAVLDGKFQSMAQLLDIMKNAEQAKAFMAQMTEEKVAGVLTQYAANLGSVAQFIRDNNTEAEVVFLTQYDPFSGISGMDQIAVRADAAILMLNDVIRMKAEEYACAYVDVHMAFLGQASAYTNMASFDILPNAQGHEQIFKVIAKYLDQVAPVVTEPDTTSPVTTAEVTTVAMETDVPAETTDASGDLPSEVPVTDATGGGCGAAVSVGVIAVIALCGVVVCKKKK